MNWIDVNDRLPDWDLFVLWVREDGYIFIADIDHDSNWANFKSLWERCAFRDDIKYKITHWMPLPEPPVKQSTYTSEF